jgi:hypothetical protein
VGEEEGGSGVGGVVRGEIAEVEIEGDIAGDYVFPFESKPEVCSLCPAGSFQKTGAGKGREAIEAEAWQLAVPEGESEGMVTEDPVPRLHLSPFPISRLFFPFCFDIPLSFFLSSFPLSYPYPLPSVLLSLRTPTAPFLTPYFHRNLKISKPARMKGSWNFSLGKRKQFKLLPLLFFPPFH